MGFQADLESLVSRQMTLPPWLWRILRSRKARRTGIASFSTLAVLGVGFYPSVKWLGERACRKVAEEVTRRGYPVPAREVSIDQLDESIYCHATFIEEANLPDSERLIGYEPPLPPKPAKSQPAWKGRLNDAKITRAEAAVALSSLAPLEERRAALVTAIRQTSPLAGLPGDDWIVMPGKELLSAYDMAGFLGEHAVLVALCGDTATALEDFEAALRLFGELRDPRLLCRVFLYQPYDLGADKLGLLSQALVLGAEAIEWREPELARLDTALAKFDFPAERTTLLNRLPGSHAYTMREIQAGRLPGPPGITPWLAGWEWEPRIVFTKLEKSWPYLKPRGLYALDRAEALHEITAAVDQAKAGLPELVMGPIFIPSRKFREASGTYGKSGDIEGRLLALQSAKAAILQQPLSMARHAIALERHRLRHGEYPRSLAELDSDLRDLLPPDPLTGRPPGYEALKAQGISYRLNFARPSAGSEGISWQAPWR